MKGKCFIIIDESGDLGMSSRSSSHFVLVASVLSDLSEYQNIARQTRKRYRKILKGCVELKHHNAREEVACHILRSIAYSEVHIHWLKFAKEHGPVLDARSIYLNMLEELLHMVLNETHGCKCKVILDRFSKRSKMAKKSIDNLRSRLERRGISTLDLDITFYDSMAVPVLQVHDFIAGSVFRMVERDDRSHYEIIEKKVVNGRAYHFSPRSRRF